jgi:hypothetical protein
MVNRNKNVFISHYNKDDEHITRLKDLLKKKGYNIKNSSIDSTKPNQASNDDYIKSLLRSRIQWAGTTIVLIGADTHKREYVNWEIEQSNKMGNNIVGVYIQKEAGAELPKNFEKYGNDLVGWNSDNIIKAIEGTREKPWQNPDGSEREGGKYAPQRSQC